MTLILASGSPTRAALLRAVGLTFTVRVPEIDEVAVRDAERTAGRSASATAGTLANLKALGVRAGPSDWVIGADQILEADGRWFAKPATPAEALSQLRILNGRRHVLHTAVCCARRDAITWSHIAAPSLTMRAMTTGALERYVIAMGDEALRTPGSYQIEGLGLTLFQAIEGEHTAILGLPMLPLLAYLRRVGVTDD